ncbi:MAG: hypothetical protein JL50_14115 [Peptococcaceae bacterium BICA1-7]|nr:MAG: hypothetical protein JL50_14115 [Peptococcaceae bacterium BICA1-7]HBV96424.1 hypothetical protein [Desulfotomaculum sp.]
MGTHQKRKGDTPAEDKVFLYGQECPRSVLALWVGGMSPIGMAGIHQIRNALGIVSPIGWLWECPEWGVV